ncbi:hypothetical protein [Paenibacillus andongensis]|uniref:hypothetical protein n=1 Tax=Paenibacillus andongensis TaxID=2975482 RepID=UPI0021BAC7AD|nr:hypothetical protein [Paenibacillus andongensis]
MDSGDATVPPQPAGESCGGAMYPEYYKWGVGKNTKKRQEALTVFNVLFSLHIVMLLRMVRNDWIPMVVLLYNTDEEKAG